MSHLAFWPRRPSRTDRRHRAFRPVADLLEDRRLLTYLSPHAGVIVCNPQVETLFLGQVWANAGLQSFKSQMNSAVATFTNSTYSDVLGQYGVHRGQLTRTDTDPTPAIPWGNSIPPVGNVFDYQIQSFLSSEINAGNLDSPTSNRVYIVYMPPATIVSRGYGYDSTNAFLGYHSWFPSVNGTPVIYAVIPFPAYPNATLVGLGLNSIQNATAVMSHELAEAVTDPIPGQGWYDDSAVGSAYGDEVGDVAIAEYHYASTVYGTVGGFTAQRLWSNYDNTSIVQPGTPSYSLQKGNLVQASAAGNFTLGTGLLSYVIDTADDQIVTLNSAEQITVYPRMDQTVPAGGAAPSSVILTGAMAMVQDAGGGINALLRATGTLTRYKLGTWTNEATSIGAIAADNNGGVAALSVTDHVLYDFNQGVKTTLLTNVEDVANQRGWLVALLSNGTLMRRTFRRWSTQATNVVQIAVDSDGTLEALTTDGTLMPMGIGKSLPVLSHVAQIVLDTEGGLDVLGTDGSLERYLYGTLTHPLAGVTSVGITAIALDSNGYLLALGTDRVLRRYANGSWSTVMTGVSALTSDFGGPDALTTAGALLHEVDVGQLFTTMWVSLANGMTSMVPDPNGGVDALNGMGVVSRFALGTQTTLMANAKAIATDSNRELLALLNTGLLGRYAQGVWGYPAIDVTSIAANLNHDVGVLLSTGTLYDFYLGSWTVVDPSATSFALSPFGSTFYALETTGNLESITAGVSTLVDSGVTWFGLGGNGRAVDVLEASGSLYQINGSTRTLLDQNVQSCTIDLATWTLIATEANGTVKRFAT